jgi:hypothetical protein
MGAPRSVSATGLTLLRGVVKKPLDYGLDYRHESLKDILDVATRHPRCLHAIQASAERKVNRCLQRTRHKDLTASHFHHRVRRQLLRVKEGLAWTDLNHVLNVSRCYWDSSRYIRLARRLCVLASLCHYYRQHFSDGLVKPVNVVATGMARLAQLKKRGWNAVRNYLRRQGLDWNADMLTHLGPTESMNNMAGCSRKFVVRDQDGNEWIIKHSPESIMNPVLASIFARLCECPGAEICPSFLDYDPAEKQPCSIQPYLRAKPLGWSVRWTEGSLTHLIGGSRTRASQMLCQTVVQCILDNIDRNQVIMDAFGNLIFVDHDRSFFIDDHAVTTDFRAAWADRQKVAPSVILAKVINATACIPGVLDDLAAFVDRVEKFPTPVYEGLVRNASFREEQLSSLYYLDTMGSRAIDSIEALNCWIERLLARKQTIRATLAKRLSEVLGSSQRYL